MEQASSQSVKGLTDVQKRQVLIFGGWCDKKCRQFSRISKTLYSMIEVLRDTLSQEAEALQKTSKENMTFYRASCLTQGDSCRGLSACEGGLKKGEYPSCLLFFTCLSLLKFDALFLPKSPCSAKLICGIPLASAKKLFSLLGVTSRPCFTAVQRST